MSNSLSFLPCLCSQRPQPPQLNQRLLQNTQLLYGLLSLGDRLGRLGGDARDNIIGKLRHHIRVQDGGQFLDQAQLDSQGADRVDDRLQSNLFSLTG